MRRFVRLAGRGLVGAALAGLMALTSAVPTAAADLVMVNSPTCDWCDRWETEIGTIYPKTAESVRAPIRRIDIDAFKASGLHVPRPVIYTPTFILMHDRRELGRITGYPGDIHFWSLLDELLMKLPPAAGCPTAGGALAGTTATKGERLC
ncbi:MAG: hypothetical protein VW405_15770 [Rhodospirillaceae bacterium]